MIGFICEDENNNQLYSLIFAQNENKELILIFVTDYGKDPTLGKYVSYDSDADGIKEKWIVLYNNSANELELVNPDIQTSMTIGDTSDIGKSVNSYNNCYTNIMDSLNNLITESTYKNSVRIFGGFEGKVDSTDEVTYNQKTYKINLYNAAIQVGNETQDEACAKKYDIKIPDNCYIKQENGLEIVGQRTYHVVTKGKNATAILYKDTYNSNKVKLETKNKIEVTALPVVKMNPNVTVDTTSGDGTESSPYELVIN